jgi:hypothetical protein
MFDYPRFLLCFYAASNQIILSDIIALKNQFSSTLNFHHGIKYGATQNYSVSLPESQSNHFGFTGSGWIDSFVLSIQSVSGND